jgi:hypothetical protein
VQKGKTVSKGTLFEGVEKRENGEISPLRRNDEHGRAGLKAAARDPVEFNA